MRVGIRQDLRDASSRMALVAVGVFLLVVIGLKDVSAQAGSWAAAVPNRRPSIVGVWRVSRDAPAVDAVTDKDAANQHRPDFAGAVNASAGELGAAWKHGSRHSGTYVLHASNQLALRPIVAADAVATEIWINVVYAVDGDSLILRDKHRQTASLERVK